jgi:hypothetical protein
MIDGGKEYLNLKQARSSESNNPFKLPLTTKQKSIFMTP